MKLLLLFLSLTALINLHADKKNSVSFKVPDNFEIGVFADQKMINNPISLAIDAEGRVYVAEIHRFRRGVVDSRQYNKWFLDELACNSLQDRLDLYKKWTDKGMFSENYFTEFSDRIVTLIDEDGDGKADKMKEFSGSYNHPLDGNGSSILFGLEGEMYYANIPHIWKITDSDKDGVAEKREKFISGFGFRSGVNGHDLHGLEWGVDGRLYFSNGDRGYRVKTKEGKILHSSERGAVFRCEPDGSGLELFTVGNRNPQDLAFDQFGNLLTVDNNRGRGDESRVCYLVELGDYGWNSGHENKTTFFWAVKLRERKGPKPFDSWKAEGDWKIPFEGQAAYCIPSIFYIGGGSAGITFNPGDSLGEKYKNHFVYSAYQRGIYTFRFEPSGGGLKEASIENFWNGGLVIDTDFSYDGRLFVADYISTNNTKSGNKGTVYVLKDDKLLKQPSVVTAHKILKDGFKDQKADVLYKNLFHEDMRVRLFSQFELANRKDSERLLKAASQEENELARLHGIWGLGQLARKDSKVCSQIIPFLKDGNWRVRGQAVKVIGESKDPDYAGVLKEKLTDEHDRVRFFAYTAFGKLAGSDAVESLVEQISAVNDQDPFLRHSAVAGLIYSNATDKIYGHASHESAAVRRGVLLALSRLEDSRVTKFLTDSDISIVQEAIRCVDRMNIHEVAEQGAESFDELMNGEPQIALADQERILQWCFRKGDAKSAKSVAALALNEKVDTKIREIALADLARWSEKLPVDPVIGQIRKINDKRFDVKEILVETVKALLKMEKDKRFTSLVNNLALELKVSVDKNKIVSQILDHQEDVATRIEYYQKLLKENNPKISEVTKAIIKDGSLQMRIAGLKGLSQIDKGAFKKEIIAKSNDQKDLKAVYTVLKSVSNHDLDEVQIKGLTALAKGVHPKESALELLESVESSKNEKINQLYASYKASLDGNDPLAAFKPVLHGGDPDMGKDLVLGQGPGQCMICHMVEGKGGIVAPDLSEIASRKNFSALYALESIVKPNAYIVPGFGNITLTLKNGSTVVGSLLKEDSKMITLKFPDGKSKEINVSDVKSRTAALSAMPPLGAILSKSDIRDIIAYLSTLKKKQH